MTLRFLHLSSLWSNFGQRWAIALVIYKIDWSRFLIISHKIDVFIILFAFMLYNLSQIVSALRCRLYLNLIACRYRMGRIYHFIMHLCYTIYFYWRYWWRWFWTIQLRRYSGIETMVIVKALLFTD